jgi:hypothetical protein
MALILSVEDLLTGGSGVLVRGFQLGVMEKPFSHSKIGYVYSAAFWTGFGYYWYQYVDTNDAILEDRITKLRQKREQRTLKEGTV